MKRIGILFGRERTFPEALATRINGLGSEVSAEPVKVGGIGLGASRSYDLVLDRVSHEVPFYRAALKKWVVDGTIVVNNPFWVSADDPFFDTVLAGALGIAVPRTVLLPSHDQPAGTSSDSFANLEYPLDWPATFEHVGFPAVVTPVSSDGRTTPVRVTTPDEFFAAYAGCGANVVALREEIAFDAWYRCYAIGREQIRAVPHDPRLPADRRPARAPAWDDPAVTQRVRADGRTIARALGHDLVRIDFAVRDGIPHAVDVTAVPEAGRGQIGQDDVEWLVDTLSRWLVHRVTSGPATAGEHHWSRYLAGDAAEGGPAARARLASPLPSAGMGRRVG
jgi:hypothetical protein